MNKLCNKRWREDESRGFREDRKNQPPVGAGVAEHALADAGFSK